MYTSFRVKNFRGFEDLELNDLARVNLIAGKNNVGKTSVMEAFFIHCGAYNPELTLRVNIFRGIQRFEFQAHSQTSWIESLFRNFDASQSITFEGKSPDDSTRSLRLTLVRDPEELKRLGPIEQKDTNGANRLSGTSSELIEVIRLEAQGGNEEPTLNYLLIDNNGIRNLLTPPPPFRALFLNDVTRSNRGEIRQRFSDLVKLGYRNAFVESMKLLEPRLRFIELLDFNGESMLHGDIGTDRPIPIVFMGDGVNRFANILLGIINTQGGIAMIDEIENGLHHSVLVDVWRAVSKAARDFNVQIFATTHSLEMIRAAHEAFKEQEPYDFRYHRLDRNEKTGQIKAVTHDEEILEAAAEANFEVR